MHRVLVLCVCSLLTIFVSSLAAVHAAPPSESTVGQLNKPEAGGVIESSRQSDQAQVTPAETVRCPHCLEPVRVGARKCPHCQSSLGSEPGDDRHTVYILDNGLIQFGKFVAATLGIFLIVGVYVFGFDIKNASETTTQARLAAEATLLEIQKAKLALDEKLKELEANGKRIEQLERDADEHRKNSEKSAALVLELLAGMRTQQAEANRIVLELRSLNPTEAIVALEGRSERGIHDNRGKLWVAGSVLRYRFLDGEEPLRATVRNAITEWGKYVNLTISETREAAEIRISFSEAGSWSYVGTDALGVPDSQPTMNYGVLKLISAKDEAMQTALHEFGHALGLVHEFQNPSAGELFDRESVLKYFKSAPNRWSEEMIESNVLAKNDAYPGSRVFDPQSIMNYVFDKELFAKGRSTQPLMVLSDSDKAYAASLYPREK